MTAIICRDDAPSHLFAISELDFSSDLFAEREVGSWFRLAAWTMQPRRDERGVEDVIERQSLLLAPAQFEACFDRLESIGNVLHGLGKPGGSVYSSPGQKEYRYLPFHQFELPFVSVVGEPLVFRNPYTSGDCFLVNPDLWLFLELEQKALGSGTWWDQRRGVDALVHRVIDDGKLVVVDIRGEHLLRYLQARQMSLVVGHYRHLHLFDPSRSTIGAFVDEEVTLGSAKLGAKAILQNWGLRKDIPGMPPFLQRRLHLWYEITPPKIDVDDPWADQPSFDVYSYTLPTRGGPVAPARWARYRAKGGGSYSGTVGNFLDRVYFRQEVLTKYEGASGFVVDDDGSVSCRNLWGLDRSTARIGNELLATAIGDFAEGVPFEEWPHWKQFAVDPPSPESVQALRQEQTVPDSVNLLVKALEALNASFVDFASAQQVTIPTRLWQGSLDSLAGRQMKWVYPSNTDDDEFLKRATLSSTLVIEGLESAVLRKLLSAIGSTLHMNDENPPRPLGSRNLLQRLTLIAVLIEGIQPELSAIPLLVRQAEGKVTDTVDPDLQIELQLAYKRVRDLLAPLAFLYDLRTFGGLAHPPNKARAATAAIHLGLPDKNWHRRDYLSLLNLVSNSIHQISNCLDHATYLMTPNSGLPD